METHHKWGSEVWFLVGLVSFLVGHIIFMYGMKSRIADLTKSKRIHKNNNWALPGMAIYSITLIGLIFPHVEDPVL